MNSAVRNIIMAVVFVVCLALVIIGQKNISGTGLAMQLVGLVGLLTELFIYFCLIHLAGRSRNSIVATIARMP